MKKSIITLTISLLFCAATQSFASAGMNPLKKYDATQIVSTYLETIATGSVDFNKYLFAKDFEYVNDVNQSKHNRRDYLSFLNSNKGLVYDCETSYTILDQTDKSCIAKATFEFKTFTRVDYITLCRTDGSWQVSKVVTTYP